MLLANGSRGAKRGRSSSMPESPAKKLRSSARLAAQVQQSDQRETSPLSRPTSLSRPSSIPPSPRTTRRSGSGTDLVDPFDPNGGVKETKEAFKRISSSRTATLHDGELVDENDINKAIQKAREHKHDGDAKRTAAPSAAKHDLSLVRLCVQLSSFLIF